MKNKFKNNFENLFFYKKIIFLKNKIMTILKQKTIASPHLSNNKIFFHELYPNYTEMISDIICNYCL